jgi:hypothetical protein
LLFQAADALHAELVEVAGDDREKAHPVKQRRAVVGRLVEDAPVEGKFTQFAVEIQRRVGEGHVRGRPVERVGIEEVDVVGRVLPSLRRVGVSHCDDRRVRAV